MLLLCADCLTPVRGQAANLYSISADTRDVTGFGPNPTDCDSFFCKSEIRRVYWLMRMQIRIQISFWKTCIHHSVLSSISLQK